MSGWWWSTMFKCVCIHTRTYRRNWYLPAPKLDHLDSAQLELVSAVVTSSSNSKNFTFQAKCMHIPVIKHLSVWWSVCCVFYQEYVRNPMLLFQFHLGLQCSLLLGRATGWSHGRWRPMFLLPHLALANTLTEGAILSFTPEDLERASSRSG